MKTNLSNILVILISLSAQLSYGQVFSGKISDKKIGCPIEYANIGITNKNVGTVSDKTGKYEIILDSLVNEDTLKVSCIGYSPFQIKVSEFEALSDHNIRLDERVFELDDIVVRPKDFKLKIFGVTAQSKIAQAGFKDNKLGYEMGILMNSKKPAFLEKLTLHISTCTYDTIFYRMNLYKVKEGKEFENVLKNPIYIELPKDKVMDITEIDLSEYNLEVKGDFMITLEHIKELGPGYLYFCAGILNSTYYRKTSQAKWETAPVGISLSVVAKVEK